MSDFFSNLVSITWWRNVFQKTSKGFGFGCALVFILPIIGFGWSQYSGRGSHNSSAATAKDALLMTVNGDPVLMGDYNAIAGSVQLGTPGESFARTSGEIVSALVQQTVLAQEAKRTGAKPNDADIDKAVQDFKIKRVGPKATDAELETYLMQSRGMSVSDLRAEIAKGSLGKALLDQEKTKTVVTEEEARNQSAEVRLNVVLIPTASTMPGMPPNPKALPDAEAQKKAEALLAEVKAGKDIAAVAKANSADSFASKGGDTGFMPEYKSMGMPESMGILGFGKEVDEAVHKAKPGDFIGAMKTSGFQTGYLFAKVAERRNNLPKDFAPQKVVDQLKDQRAQQVLVKRIEDKTKAAKVVFDKDHAVQKAYYDYFLYAKAEQAKMMSFSDPTAGPSAEELDKQKAAVDAEIEALYKSDPANETAAILILNSLKGKLVNPKTPPAEQTAIRERLLPLYQTIIKSSEGPGFEYRFGLAEALRDKKQFAEAYKNYSTITRMIDSDQPSGTKGLQEAKATRQKLMLGLKSVASPEVPNADSDAATQQKKIQELDTAILVAQQQEMEDRRRQAEEQKRQQAEELKKSQAAPPAPGGTKPAAPEGFGNSIDLGPGGKKTITIPATGGTPPAPSGGTPAPTGNAPAPPAGSPPPPSGGTGR